MHAEHRDAPRAARTPIVLASNNAHKAHEFGRILAGYRLLLPRELGVRFTHEETGASFAENALAKANALRSQLAARGDIPPPLVLADDSGLCVDALDGAPGIHSNRFGTEGDESPLLSDQQKMELLLQHMRGVSDRRARFICAAALVVDDHRFYLVQESFEGEIAPAAAGSGGFGYDPLFLLPHRGMTVAQLPPGEKDLISHRARAGRKILALLRSLESDDPFTSGCRTP